MKARLILYRFQALLLVLCLLPITAAAGVVDSNALAYEKAVQMLTTSSLTDGEKLEVIRAQFEQAGSYQLGVDYLTLTDALVILQAGNANRFDDALDNVRRLSRNDRFVSHYSSHVDRAGQPILPDLEMLIQYIAARKLEAYQDLAGAVLLYDRYPVLDAVYRAGLLTSSIKLSQYERAVDLLLEGTPESIQQAAAIFEELGDFRDSPKRLQECRERMEALATLAPVITIKPTRSPEPTVQPPASLSISVSSGTVTLRWTPVSGVDEYRIYRADSPQGSMKLIGTFQATEFIDASVQTGRTYDYQVAAVKGFRESSLTVSVQAVIPSPTPKPTVKPTATLKPIPIPTSTTKLPKVGETITFGHYEQDNNLSNGKEPIEWRVLAIENGKVLMISLNNLDALPYHYSNSPVTWETCSLRGWLNSRFLNSAFSQAEQGVILTTLVNNGYDEYGISGVRDTRDKIFLLSFEEVEILFRGGKTSRISMNTAYAETQGAYTNDSGSGSWWLRSTGNYSYYNSTVDASGTIGSKVNYIFNGTHAVRPAFWLDLSSL